MDVSKYERLLAALRSSSPWSLGDAGADGDSSVRPRATVGAVWRSMVKEERDAQVQLSLYTILSLPIWSDAWLWHTKGGGVGEGGITQ